MLVCMQEARLPAKPLVEAEAESSREGGQETRADKGREGPASAGLR